METGGYTALWLLGDPAAYRQRNSDDLQDML
jgi:hypothetical protein